MKTRKILAASTAALLSMASIAVVASAQQQAPKPVDIEYDEDGDYTTAGDIGYKIAKADKDKFADLTILGIGAEATSSTSATAVRALVGDDMKDKLVNAIVEKLYNTDDSAVTGAMFDIAVGKASTDGSVSRKEINLKAPIEINIEGLSFEANHVYHVDGSKLVEIKTEDLTEEIDTDADTHTYGVIFKSKTFSPFIITKDAVKGAVALDSDENPAGDDDSDASSDASGAAAGDNANTGIALAIAPVVLAAGAVAVVALKKKH